jgi:hypothetical protein
MGAATYIDQVRATAPVAYWPLNEAAASAAVNYGTLGAAANGTYTGVTLANTPGPDGVTMAPLFDGTNDYVDVQTGALETAWTMGGAEWSVMAWFKVYNAGVWTDGTDRRLLSTLYDSNNYLSIYKQALNNTWTTLMKAGGTSKLRSDSGFSSTTWQHYTLTRSETADELIPYINASPLVTLTSIGTWAAATPWSKMLIGAATATPTLVWHGWLGHIAMWNRPLTQAEITALYAP